MPEISARPHIVLVHGHDLGDWLSCYGRDDIPSPQLQRFADDALVFDAAFATSPLCTPARSSLFTGRMPHTNGLMGLSHSGWQYAPGVQTLPELLADAGYRTALIGLQHEDLDARVLGYEEVHGQGFLPRALEVAGLSERWFSEVGDERPYFASVGMWEVHRPWPVEDYEPVDPQSVQLPPYLADNEHTRRDVSQFLGAIRQMDEAVGRILAAIEASAGAANTVVIFTTDHGVAFPRAKSTLYDSGVKVALMIKPPASWGVAGGRSELLVSHLDIVPTVLELAGAQQPEPLDGQSLLGALRGEQPDWSDRALVLEKTYHDRYDPIRAIRTTTAKYIRNFVDAAQLPLSLDLEQSETRKGMGDAHLRPRPSEELYRLDTDPWELSNVAADPASAELRAELAAALDARLRASHDPILSGPIPAPASPRRGASDLTSAR